MSNQFKANFVSQTGDVFSTALADDFSMATVSNVPLHIGLSNTDSYISINPTSVIVNSNLQVKGNLTVSGSTVTVNTSNMNIQDNIITLNAGETGTGVSAGTAGITIDRGNGLDYQILFNETEGKFKMGADGSLQAIATEAYVDASQPQGVLYAASNLSDIGDAGVARNNLGLGSNDTVNFKNIELNGFIDIGKTQSQDYDFRIISSKYSSLATSYLHELSTNVSTHILLNPKNSNVIIQGVVDPTNPTTGMVDPGNNKLYVHGNTSIQGNMGIGTISPAYKLDVNGITNSTAVQTTGPVTLKSGTATNANQIRFNNGLSNNGEGSGYTIQQIDNGGANRFRLGRNGYDDINIASNGYVGIGNANPFSKLYVQGNTYMRGKLIGANGYPPSSNVGYGLDFPDPTGWPANYSELTKNSGAHKYLNTYFMNYLTAQNGHGHGFTWVLDTLGTRNGIMHLNGNENNVYLNVLGDVYTKGNMGVGTSNPTQTLYVNGSFGLSNVRSGYMDWKMTTEGNGMFWDYSNLTNGDRRQHSISLGNDFYSTSTGNIVIYQQTANHQIILAANQFRPYRANDDNTMSFGSITRRWTTIYTTNGISQTSDDRVKTDEVFITNATETLKKLRPQTYNKWSSMADLSNNDASKTVYESGLIAQEVFYDAPELRHLVTLPEGIDSNLVYDSNITSSQDPSIDPSYPGWGSNLAGFNYTGLIPYLIKSLQEKDAQIAALESNTINQIAALEARLSALENP